MDRKVRVSVLIVLGVALALAGQVAGNMRAAFAGAGTAASYSLDAAVRQLIPARLEDGVAPELTVDLEVHRRVLAGNINSRALNPNKQACIRSCPAPGRPYTGRGCQAVYRCPH